MSHNTRAVFRAMLTRHEEAVQERHHLFSSVVKVKVSADQLAGRAFRRPA